MGDQEICWMSALELRDAYGRRELSPVEATKAILERIDEVNPKINAIITHTPELALSAAKAAEEAYARGDAGPLAGVPVTIKDLIVTKGIRTTCGSKLYEDNVPDVDAVLVERLREAGVGILGKTNVPEFGLVAYTDNVLFGPTRNPWNMGKTVGGSSGGAAAAIAAGLGPLAAGNDGGGSIRIPAHFCGVFGIKPHFGRVPSYPHVVHGWETMNCEGPITRTVADAALMLDVMAGPDNRDRNSLPECGMNFLDYLKGGVKGLKVAFSTDLSVSAVEPEIVEVTKAAAQVFADLGCEVTEDDPGIPFMDQELITITIADTVAAHQDHLDKAKELMYPLYRPYLDLEDAFSAVDYVKVQFHRDDMWDKMRLFFERYDLLLTPTATCPAFDIKEGGALGPEKVCGREASPASWVGYTFPFNFTGQPAASVPAGFTKEGLPVGLQIVGNRFDELLILRAAAAFEEARPWREKKPEF